ncbi:hypothetical protein [Paraclostridium bifermentans]|uniref:hypothetical protein n=1 Tax=Paraclostridium bifermentans TaxID=1490 RepID=UPI0018975052|nr:hypothetical protein [Paraclostridium bifermentans]
MSNTSKINRLHINRVLKNHGQFIITERGIKFCEWRFIEWNQIKEIKLQNDIVINSKMFATQSRLSFMESSKPLRISLENEDIYFYVDWRFSTGLSKNKTVLEMIKKYL